MAQKNDPSASSRALLVFRDRSYAHQARKALRGAGIKTDLVDNGFEALVAARRATFAVIVYEHELADASGFSFIAHAREAEVAAPILLVVRGRSSTLDMAALQLDAQIHRRERGIAALARRVRAMVQEPSHARGPLSDSSWGGRKPREGRAGTLPTIPGLRIKRRISAGGMGVVFEAWDLSRKCNVALKLLHPELAHDRGLCKRFLTEARHAASVVHPRIIRIIEISASKLPWFTMELVGGCNLRGLLKRERLEYGRILEIVGQVAEALQVAHAQDIIHRDIKPSNIMIDAEGQVKVLDFGLAKCFRLDQDLTRTGQVLGTPAYFSPEQASGGEVDGRCDLYSLGVTLYEALAGTAPFRASTSAGYIYLHRFCTPRSIKALRPELPAGLEMLLRSLLAKNPDKRPANPSALLAALAELRQEIDNLGLSHGRLGGARLAPLRFRDASSPRPYIPLGETSARTPAGPGAHASGLRKLLVAACLFALLAGGAWWLHHSDPPLAPTRWGLAGSPPLLAVPPESLEASAHGPMVWQRGEAAGDLVGRGRGWLPVLAARSRFCIDGWLRDLGAESFGLYLLHNGEQQFSLKVVREANVRSWVIAVLREDASGERWSFPLHSAPFEELQAFGIEVEGNTVRFELGRDQIYQELLPDDAGVVPALFVESDTGAAGFEQLRVRFALPQVE